MQKCQIFITEWIMKMKTSFIWCFSRWLQSWKKQHRESLYNNCLHGSSFRASTGFQFPVMTHCYFTLHQSSSINIEQLSRACHEILSVSKHPLLQMSQDKHGYSWDDIYSLATWLPSQSCLFSRAESWPYCFALLRTGWEWATHLMLENVGLKHFLDRKPWHCSLRSPLNQ